MYVILLLFSLLFATTSAWAQPSISGVSGTVGHGQSITISGSNFGSSGLMLYDNFDTYANGGVVANSSSGSTPLIHQGGLSGYSTWDYDCAGPSCESYDYTFNNTNLRPNSTYHARTYFGTSNSWNQALYLGYSLTAGNELYVSYYFRDTHSGGPRQMKAIVAYDSSWTNQWYLSSGYGNGCAPDNGWRLHEPSTPWENWFTFGADDTLNKWIRIESWIKQSNSGTANGNWHATIYRPTESPRSRGSETSDNVVTYTGSATSRITLGGAYYDMCSGAPTANFDVDNIYVSTSRARVELCDSGTWSSRTHCELQVPSSWSASSITATVDAGYFSTNDTAYLYVIDSNGAISSARSVTIGQSSGGDTTAPTVYNVSSDKANGTYGVGEVIDIDVTFSEAVTSNGNVTVTLETGAVDRSCTFTVTNATTGTCNYTVQAGDTSSDLTVSSISGTIADQASNAMTNFVPATNLAANKAIVIDTTAPTTNITISNPITIMTDTLNATGTCSDGSAKFRLTSEPNGSSGTACSGTTSFTCSTSGYSIGSNTLYIECGDSVGNWATGHSITVYYDPSPRMVTGVTFSNSLPRQ